MISSLSQLTPKRLALPSTLELYPGSAAASKNGEASIVPSRIQNNQLSLESTGKSDATYILLCYYSAFLPRQWQCHWAIMSCLYDKHRQKPQGWWVSMLSILQKDNHWLESFQRFKSCSRVPVANNSNIEGTIVSWFHWKEMVIGHWGGISKSSETRTFHCATTYLYVILVIILDGGFPHGFSPSGLSHRCPPFEQLVRPCLYSSNFSRHVVFSTSKLKL